MIKKYSLFPSFPFSFSCMKSLCFQKKIFLRSLILLLFNNCATYYGLLRSKKFHITARRCACRKVLRIPTSFFPFMRTKGRKKKERGKEKICIVERSRVIAQKMSKNVERISSYFYMYIFCIKHVVSTTWL